MQYLAEPTAATFCPGSPKNFWQSCILDFGSGSKISALDPRRCFEHLGSWILDPYNVRLEIFKSEPFSDLRFSSRRNRSKTKKQSMSFRQKHYLTSFVFVFCLLWLYRGFVAMHPRFSKNFPWIRTQDPRSKIIKKLFLDPGQKSRIQTGLLDPRFSNTSFAPWDPKSDSCSDLRSQVWGPTCYLKISCHLCIYIYIHIYIYKYLYTLVCMFIKGTYSFLDPLRQFKLYRARALSLSLSLSPSLPPSLPPSLSLPVFILIYIYMYIYMYLI